MAIQRAPAAGGAGGGCSGPTSTLCPRSARWRSRSAFPLVQVVRDSFYAGSFDSPIWVGLDNYKGVIDDPEFRAVAAEQPEAAAGGAR